MTKGLIAAAAILAATPLTAQQTIAPAPDSSRALFATPAPETPFRTGRLEKPAGDWQNIGKGVWFEDIMTFFTDVPAGLSWELDIEESATTPGWYRMLPYGQGSPVADIFGATDTRNYIYVNATDPSKVYFEDFDAFGTYTVTHFCEDGGWMDYGDEMCGTVADNIISFPKRAAGLRQKGGWAYGGWERTNLSGNFRIALPGSTPSDYTLRLSAPYCANSNKVVISYEIGADISSLKAIVLTGEYTTEGDNAALVVSRGQDLNTLSNSVSASPDKKGMYSFLIVGLDAADNIVAHTWANFYVELDDADNWEDCGSATLTEGMLCEFFSDVNPEDLTCKLQRHKTTANYFRLVNPFAGHSYLGGFAENHDGHNHYIYINDSGIGEYYFEASPVGLNIPGYGQVAIWGWAERYAQNGLYKEAHENGLFGTRQNDVITLPDGYQLMGFSAYNGGQLMSAGTGVKIRLDITNSGIDSAVSADDAANAEYFNLQGVRVDKPSAGLYIRRCGTRTDKVFVR